MKEIFYSSTISFGTKTRWEDCWTKGTSSKQGWRRAFIISFAAENFCWARGLLANNFGNFEQFCCQIRKFVNFLRCQKIILTHFSWVLRVLWRRNLRGDAVRFKNFLSKFWREPDAPILWNFDDFCDFDIDFKILEKSCDGCYPIVGQIFDKFWLSNFVKIAKLW